MDDLWNQVLAEIQIEVSSPRFIAFFKSTKLVKLENNVATIGTPNPMTADLLEKNYYSLIKNILDKKTRENVSLIFVIQREEVKKTEETGPLFMLSQQPMLSKNRPAHIREDY